jgi:hypothetical protein
MTDPRLREAACSCGDLKIRLRGDPTYVSSCCCQACQRRSGSLYGVTAFFAEDQVEGTEGTATNFHRIAESGNGLTFHFCPRCGSSVWVASASLEALSPTPVSHPRSACSGLKTVIPGFVRPKDCRFFPKDRIRARWRRLSQVGLPSDQSPSWVESHRWLPAGNLTFAVRCPRLAAKAALESYSRPRIEAPRRQPPATNILRP